MTNKINGIDVSEYFIEVVDEGGSTINYKILPNFERLLVEKIFEQNQQLKCLQKENEGLKKKQITKNGFICDCEQNAKYKQALEEIKKWATNHNPCDIDPEVKCTKEDCFEYLNYDIKKITRIIDEVLSNV